MSRCLLWFPELSSNTHCVNDIPDTLISLKVGGECSEIMPESWWSWCTSQHLRADWKVWKMLCGVELGGLRNTWWKVFAPCLASCKWLWGLALCSLEKADLTECCCGKRCSSSPESPHFSSWTSRSSLAKLKGSVPDCLLLYRRKRAQLTTVMVPSPRSLCFIVD